MQNKIALAACLALAAASPTWAKDIYVSSTTGDNSGDGSKEKPIKLLWKAMGKVAAGDTLHVAEGVYPGQKKSGVMPKIEVPQLKILGGYKADWSVRQPFEHLSIIAGAADRQADTKEVFFFEDSQTKDVSITIDGFCIDRGPGNYYSGAGPGGPTMIEGHVDTSAWGYQAINKKKSGSDPAIELLGKGSFTVRNMLIVNNPWWGISIKAGGTGEVLVENNLILGYQGRGMEIITGGGWGKPTYIIRNNTIAFGTHMEGRALSLDPRDGYATKYVVENNVLCGGYQSGIMTKFGAALLTLNNNLFFGFRGADVGDGGSAKCNVAEFEDELEFPNAGNVHEAPKFLAKLSQAWIDRWSQWKALADTEYFTSDEMMAARKVAGLGAYELPFFPGKTYAGYAELPSGRINFDMSRYPQSFKQGEGDLDWKATVLPMIGADGARGVQPFKE